MSAIRKIKADDFIKMCLERGRDPASESRTISFGTPHETRAMREHIEAWRIRRDTESHRTDNERSDVTTGFLRLPCVGGLAIEKTRTGVALKPAFRIYDIDTRQLIFQIPVVDIPAGYLNNDDAAIAYAGYLATGKSFLLKMANNCIS